MTIAEKINTMTTEQFNRAVERGELVQIGKEIADELSDQYETKVVRQTLEKACREGRLDAAKVGRSWYSKRAVLDEYMKSRRKSPSYL